MNQGRKYGIALWHRIWLNAQGFSLSKNDIMRNIKLFFTLMMASMLLFSCSTQNKISKQNLADTYVDNFSGKFMQYQLFHLNDSISTLSVRLDASKIPGLATKKLDVYSLIRLNYQVYSTVNMKDFIQADSYKLSDLIPFDKIDAGAVEVKIPLHLKDSSKYFIRLNLKDQVNKKDFVNVIRTNKNPLSAENYQITDDQGNLLWYSWLPEGQKFMIHYRYQGAHKVYMSYFKPQFSPAPPPYAQILKQDLEFNRVKPFDHYEISLKNGQSSVFQLPKEGAYLIHAKKDVMQGKMITQFYQAYPDIQQIAQKVFALRYLNPKKEFMQMLKDEPQHTLKEFWFFEGRTEDRSKQMMGSYYGRVLRANELFTSYKEGWKTDRGMIFMVYGPPDYVHYELDREVWEYGSDAAYNDLEFEFILTNTPLNNQEYILLRNQDFKKSWYSILENWRNK